MTKVRSNALWNELSPENREILDTWLFEQNLSYAKILFKAQRELGFKGSIGSLGRYRKRREQERLITTMEEAGKDAVQAGQTGASPEALRQANMRVLNVYLFEALRKNPDAVKELMPMVKAMLQNDYTEMLREAKARDHGLREQAMAFKKERFEFDMAEKALKALPELKELAEAKKNPNLSRYAENAYWNQLRQSMFGMGIKVHPESAEEEAQMLAAKQERDAKEGRKPDTTQKVITESQPPVPASPHYEEYLEAKARREQRRLAAAGPVEKLQTPTTQASAVASTSANATPVDGEASAVVKSTSAFAEATADKMADGPAKHQVNNENFEYGTSNAQNPKGEDHSK